MCSSITQGRIKIEPSHDVMVYFKYLITCTTLKQGLREVKFTCITLKSGSIMSVGFLILEDLPVRKKCIEAQQVWDRFSESNEEVLSNFRKKKTLTFIWESNRLEGTLPKEAKQKDVEKVLMEAVEERDVSKLNKVPACTSGSSIDKPTQQLMNHLKAFFCLCPRFPDKQSLPNLSEELIKHTHGVMMQGLETDDGTKVNAGVYRAMSVHAGDHVFPSHKCIPANMARIVAEYESKATHDHDHLQLASWLFFQVVSLHPFEDGNGRLSRLLWCYSLMRDGLPFPAVLTSGHRRSQKHLVRCLEHDRRLSVSDQPHLTNLSVVSIKQAWDSFLEDSKTPCAL